MGTNSKELEEQIRAGSVLLSELPEEEREPFWKHMLDTAPRSVPSPLQSDQEGDHRFWIQDYHRWKRDSYEWEWELCNKLTDIANERILGKKNPLQ
jgi:hypothetical protein